VPEAQLFSLCFLPRGDLATSRSQSNAPLVRSNINNIRRCWISSAPVTKMRLSHTIGEEWPAYGTAVRHAMFSFLVASHWRGRFVSVLLPSPRGPRHPGQFSAGESPGTIKRISSEIFQIGIVESLLAGGFRWRAGEASRCHGMGPRDIAENLSELFRVERRCPYLPSLIL